MLLLMDQRDMVKRFRSDGERVKKHRNFLHRDVTCDKRTHRETAVAKDTDDDDLRKPLDGEPLGALRVPVAPLTHLKHTNKHEPH